MGEIDNINNSKEVETVGTKKSLTEFAEEMLLDARATINNKNTLSMPIVELSTLGAGVSSLIPALNTVTQTTTFATEGLYQLANAGVGDVLKVARNGNFFGSFKTAEGASKFVQLQAAAPLSATTTTVAAINPAMMLMAVALFTIEKELGNIAEMGKQILSFLEVEKESEIEADVETLMDIIIKYKFNWDNKHFVASNHKLVLDIQRTARKNMNAYQKKIKDVLTAKRPIVVQNKVNSRLTDFEKKFKYYRLSLYTFSLASLMEIMLSGNFIEEYIIGIKDEVRRMSQAYRDLFEECSVRLEMMGNSALVTNFYEKLGDAGETASKFIDFIPQIKKETVGEYLLDKSDHFKNKAIRMKMKPVEEFAALGNPGIGMLVEKMQDMLQIYNHTSQIYFDNENIYLVSN